MRFLRNRSKTFGEASVTSDFAGKRAGKGITKRNIPFKQNIIGTPDTKSNEDSVTGSLRAIDKDGILDGLTDRFESSASNSQSAVDMERSRSHDNKNIPSRRCTVAPLTSQVLLSRSSSDSPLSDKELSKKQRPTGLRGFMMNRGKNKTLILEEGKHDLDLATNPTPTPTPVRKTKQVSSIVGTAELPTTSSFRAQAEESSPKYSFTYSSSIVGDICTSVAEDDEMPYKVIQPLETSRNTSSMTSQPLPSRSLSLPPKRVPLSNAIPPKEDASVELLLQHGTEISIIEFARTLVEDAIDVEEICQQFLARVLSHKEQQNGEERIATENTDVTKSARKTLASLNPRSSRKSQKSQSKFDKAANPPARMESSLEFEDHIPVAIRKLIEEQMETAVKRVVSKIYQDRASKGIAFVGVSPSIQAKLPIRSNSREEKEADVEPKEYTKIFGSVLYPSVSGDDVKVQSLQLQTSINPKTYNHPKAPLRAPSHMNKPVETSVASSFGKTNLSLENQGPTMPSRPQPMFIHQPVTLQSIAKDEHMGRLLAIQFNRELLQNVLERRERLLKELDRQEKLLEANDCQREIYGRDIPTSPVPEDTLSRLPCASVPSGSWQAVELGTVDGTSRAVHDMASLRSANVDHNKEEQFLQSSNARIASRKDSGDYKADLDRAADTYDCTRATLGWTSRGFNNSPDDLLREGYFEKERLGLSDIGKRIREGVLNLFVSDKLSCAEQREGDVNGNGEANELSDMKYCVDVAKRVRTRSTYKKGTIMKEIESAEDHNEETKETIPLGDIASLEGDSVCSQTTTNKSWYGSDSTKLYPSMMVSRDSSAKSFSSILDRSVSAGVKHPFIEEKLETESLVASSGGNSIGSLGSFDEAMNNPMAAHLSCTPSTMKNDTSAPMEIAKKIAAEIVSVLSGDHSVVFGRGKDELLGDKNMCERSCSVSEDSPITRSIHTLSPTNIVPNHHVAVNSSDVPTGVEATREHESTRSVGFVTLHKIVRTASDFPGDSSKKSEDDAVPSNNSHQVNLVENVNASKHAHAKTVTCAKYSDKTGTMCMESDIDTHNMVTNLFGENREKYGSASPTSSDASVGTNEEASERKLVEEKNNQIGKGKMRTSNEIFLTLATQNDEDNQGTLSFQVDISDPEKCQEILTKEIGFALMKDRASQHSITQDSCTRIAEVSLDSQQSDDDESLGESTLTDLLRKTTNEIDTSSRTSSLMVQFGESGQAGDELMVEVEKKNTEFMRTSYSGWSPCPALFCHGF